MRFGVHELNPEAGELRKNGVKLKLQDQPFQVLLALLKQPGQVVTREALREKVWPGHTFVDFDQGLNTAIAKIREALGDSASNPLFVETVPRRRYRFIAPVKERRVQSRRLLPHLSLLLIGLVLVALGLYLRQTHEATAPGGLAIAVLALDNLSSDPDQEWFSDGMTEELTTQLAKIGALHVISPTSAMRFKDSELTLPQIAQRLKVNHILGGSVRRSNGQVRITARLVEASSDRLLWTEIYQREERDVLKLQEEISRTVASEVRVKLTPEESGRLSSAAEVDPAAHEAYLKGIFFRNTWTKEGLQRAIRYFADAIEIDATFAKAYAELAPCYLMAVWGGAAPGAALIPKAMEAATRAVELDPQLAEAHAAMGSSLAFAWNWQESEREFWRAIELNPGLSSPHADLAAYCLVPQGRIQEALDEIDLAITLDPLSVRHLSTRGAMLRTNGQHAESIKAVQEALSLDPTDALSHMRVAMANMALGRWNDAVDSLDKAREFGRMCDPCMAAAVAGTGDADEARRLLHAANFQPPVASAEALVVLGDTDRAFELLEEAYRQRDFLLAYITVYEGFDPIRSDPRYIDLAKRMNLEP